MNSMGQQNTVTSPIFLGQTITSELFAAIRGRCFESVDGHCSAKLGDSFSIEAADRSGIIMAV